VRIAFGVTPAPAGALLGWSAEHRPAPGARIIPAGGKIMEMGSYCKAYLAQQFRAYPGWSENQANVRKDKKEVDGKEIEVAHDIADDSILYLQENYVVTDDIFKDEYIIFDHVTDEWKQFCHETLQFEVPVYEPIEIPHAEPAEVTPPPAPPPPAAPAAE
jgi:hypothetical protein